MTPNPSDDYATLAALLEREVDLIRERHLDELAALHKVQAGLRDTLPPVAPLQALPLLQHCRDLQERITVELALAREAILLELGTVRHAQRAADGYKPMRPLVARIAASA